MLSYVKELVGNFAAFMKPTNKLNEFQESVLVTKLELFRFLARNK